MGKGVRNMTLALLEMSSEIAHGRNQYAWMAPKPSLVGVVRPAGRTDASSWRGFAKTLRDSLQAGPARGRRSRCRRSPPRRRRRRRGSRPRSAETPKPDIRSGPDAWKSDPPPIPPHEYDGDAGGPRSLDEVIFD